MYSSFIAIDKRFVAAHWNTCKPFLLLSGWAALAAYGLMLLCLYPYPVTVSELATVFLKLFCLSNVSVLSIYVSLAMLKATVMKLAARMRMKAVAKTAKAEENVPDALPALLTNFLLAEPVLCYEEDSMQPSFC